MSSEDQAREGFSLQAQSERLGAYATATGLTLTEIISDEAESAKSLKRPGITRLFDEVRRGRVAAVIVLKLDRLTRSVRDLADILDIFAKTNTALISVMEHLDTSSASGRLMLNLLASVSQWEREAISERTAIALEYKRKSGLAYSPTPFGYRRDGGRLVVDEREYEALLHAWEMRRSGVTLRAIGQWLSDSGFTPKRGGVSWHPSTVRRVLSSKMTSHVLAMELP